MWISFIIVKILIKNCADFLNHLYLLFVLVSATICYYFFLNLTLTTLLTSNLYSIYLQYPHVIALDSTSNYLLTLFFYYVAQMLRRWQTQHIYHPHAPFVYTHTHTHTERKAVRSVYPGYIAGHQIITVLVHTKRPPQHR